MYDLSNDAIDKYWPRVTTPKPLDLEGLHSSVDAYPYGAYATSQLSKKHTGDEHSSELREAYWKAGVERCVASAMAKIKQSKYNMSFSDLRAIMYQ